MICRDTTWHWHVKSWHEVTWRDKSWHDMTWQDRRWHERRWQALTWRDKTQHDGGMTQQKRTKQDMKWHEKTREEMPRQHPWHDTSRHEKRWRDETWHDRSCHAMPWHEKIWHNTRRDDVTREAMPSRDCWNPYQKLSFYWNSCSRSNGNSSFYWNSMELPSENPSAFLFGNKYLLECSFYATSHWNSHSYSSWEKSLIEIPIEVFCRIKFQFKTPVLFSIKFLLKSNNSLFRIELLFNSSANSAESLSQNQITIELHFLWVYVRSEFELNSYWIIL